MNEPLHVTAGLPGDIDIDDVSWMRLSGGPEFDYPIDYAYAVAEADPERGRIELLIRWEPDAYCHYHRHLGTTTARVIAGEQHIHEERPAESVHKVRTAGFEGKVADGDVHMEHAGPEGLTMLFSVHAPDGRLFDLLDADGNTLLNVTIADLVERRLGEPCVA